MKTLIQPFYAWYRNTLRNSRFRWLIIGGTLLYLLSPIDISPDMFPIVGWIDDGIVVTVLMAELSQMLLDRRQRQKNKFHTDTEPNAAGPTVNVQSK